MENNSKIVIAGGTGMIGKALASYFSDRYEVIVLSRNPRLHYVADAKVIDWDASRLGDWVQELEGAAAVINLAGYPVDCLWDSTTKERIVSSRILSTRCIGHAISTLKGKKPFWLNASAIGYYGDTQGRVANEFSEPGKGFLSETAVYWETAQTSFTKLDCKTARLRFGLVLSPEGGAFPLMYKFVKWYIGGTLGVHQRYISWVHILDVCKIVDWIIQSQIEGPINIVSPKPVLNNEFMEVFRKCMRKPWAPPLPECFVPTLSKILKTELSLALDSQNVESDVLKQHRYQYEFPTLDTVLNALVKDVQLLAKL